jgi:hypothetical protein
MAKRGRKRQPKPSPDQGLAPANFPALNERFYNMSPEDYFSRRLMSLMLWLGFPDGFQSALRSEFSAEGVGVQWQSDLPDDEAEKNRKRFATADAEVILHHVSETLLRLYLVHASRSPCPWLDLARERSFAKFKKQVEKLRERLQSGEERESLQLVFFGGNRESFDPVPDEARWEAASKNVARFLDHYAGHFLDSAPYNAAKHGMAVMTGDSSFQVGVNNDEEGPFLSQSGPALEYLVVADNDGKPKWAQETKWIDLPVTIRLAGMARDLIEALWAVGAAHRGGDKPERIRLFDKQDYDELISRGKEEVDPDTATLAELISTDRMSMTLLYFEEKDS